MNLICPYCYAELDEESNFCCGEAGHGVEPIKQRIYYVRPEMVTPDEPSFGFYVSPAFDGDKCHGPYSSKQRAEEVLEEMS